MTPACPWPLNAELPGPESGLPGLEICSLKSSLTSGFDDLQGNSLYFIFQASSGCLILTSAQRRQSQIKLAGTHSYFSVTGPSLLMGPTGKIRSQTDKKIATQNFRWRPLGQQPCGGALGMRSVELCWFTLGGNCSSLSPPNLRVIQ